MFNTRIVSNLVLLVDDGLIGCAVAGSHMPSFVSYKESGATRLVVLVSQQDDWPFLDDTSDALKRRSRKYIQRLQPVSRGSRDHLQGPLGTMADGAVL